MAVNSLSESFSEFIASATRLEGSYRDLQIEVSLLRRQLEERNRELEHSIAEAEGMRSALKRILDALPCGVLLFDAEQQQAELANPEARRLLGIGEAICPADRLPREVQRVLEQAMNDGENEGEWHYEIEIEGEAGSRWIAWWRAQRSRYGGTGLFSHAVLICSDVTARKRSEAMREQTRNLVALGEMSTVLAHEIRNPLAGLELITDLLEKGGEGSPERGQWISCLRAGVRQLCATTNNVLAFYAEGSLALEELDVRELVRECERFALPMAEQAGIEISSEYEAEELLVQGSREALKQAVLNVLMNALRHTPAGGRVQVAARREARLARAVLEIKDTGCGISEKDMALVFDAGFSGSGATPGLGLSVCRRILEQHEGRISIGNSQPCGALVRMEVPIQ